MSESPKQEAAPAAAEKPQDAPASSPVSKAPAAAEKPQASAEPRKAVPQETPENEFAASERAADYAGPLLEGEFPPDPVDAAIVRAVPVLDSSENETDHPSRLPPAARPCKAGP